METSKKQWLKGYLTYVGNGRVQKVIAPATANALLTFCEQEPEFLQAVEQSGKTFEQCLNAISQGVSSAISDIDVFRRAVRFYFSEADINVVMTIDMCGKVNAEQQTAEPDPVPVSEPESEPAPKKMTLSLDDLIDF